MDQVIKFIVKVLKFIVVSIILVACSDSNSEKKTSKNSQKQEFKLVQMPEVNKDSVFNFVKKQVDFGPRTPNSKAQKECAKWMASKLTSYNFDVQIQRGIHRAYDGVDLEYNNIIGRFGLDKKKRVLLTAHWDTRPWADQDFERTDEPIDGANDGGSGVAVILEIARLINQQTTNVGVDVVLFDIEDYGKANETFCYGSQIWMKDTRLDSLKPIYGINLDMVGDPNAVFLYEGYSQEFARPVLDKVWNVAKHMGHSRYFKTIQDGMITDDHYYVNKAGIPCIDIIHRDPQTGSFPNSWHTHNDNIKNISASTLKSVTEVVLQTIYRE